MGDELHIQSSLVQPVCLVPILGEPFPAVHRLLEFRVAVIDNRPFFFFVLGSAPDDVLVTRLFSSVEDAFGDLRAWVAWLMEGPGVMAAMGDVATESFLREWTPGVGQ